MGTAATTGLLYQPRMMGEGDCEEIGRIKICRGTEVLGENLPQRHFVHHNSQMTRPDVLLNLKYLICFELSLSFANNPFKYKILSVAYL
jgi:hypothetical protein